MFFKIIKDRYILYRILNLMVKVFLPSELEKHSLNIKDLSTKVLNKVLEFKFIPTNQVMKVNGVKI